jgi:translation initiation factor 1 (eIF-1/SUI1)
MSVQNLNSFGEIACHPPRSPYQHLRIRTLTHTPTDPFADEGDPLGSSNDVGSQQNYIHIRIQQRNGRKTLTTLQGLPKGELSGFVCDMASWMFSAD